MMTDMQWEVIRKSIEQVDGGGIRKVDIDFCDGPPNLKLCVYKMGTLQPMIRCDLVLRQSEVPNAG